MYWGYNTGQREIKQGVATIYEYERGLLYAGGKLIRVLEAGRYRIWPFTHRRIVIVDTRRAAVQIANQKLLTADQITVTLNIVADYEIADVEAAIHRVASYSTQLYEDVQLAARNSVGAVTVDALLQERDRLNAQIREAVRALAESYGVRVLNVGIKDVILAPKVRDLLMKEAEAKRVAQAMLIGAREEVAALRALANAARLAEQHPHLMRLRELDAVRAFAQAGGNTVVVGMGSALPLTRNGERAAQTVTEVEPEES
ncbi:MAG TPA: slipin family protein [Chthonomonadaceae bacterium]|nr:slipin family protein [Chthonomonadaceae bacterium]